MPGLIESHSHLQKDYGEAAHRAWLAFGITTVRSPGNTPYEGVEDIEANESGVRPGPRLFSTGYLFEWRRTYYKMGVAISSPAHLEMELELSKVLQHDLIKSYVRLPDLQQKRMVEFAHGSGSLWPPMRFTQPHMWAWTQPSTWPRPAGASILRSRLRSSAAMKT